MSDKNLQNIFTSHPRSPVLRRPRLDCFGRNTGQAELTIPNHAKILTAHSKTKKQRKETENQTAVGVLVRSMLLVDHGSRPDRHRSPSLLHILIRFWPAATARQQRRPRRRRSDDFPLRFCWRVVIVVDRGFIESDLPRSMHLICCSSGVPLTG